MLAVKTRPAASATTMWVVPWPVPITQSIRFAAGS